MVIRSRHCEERSDEASSHADWMLRCARNDERLLAPLLAVAVEVEDRRLVIGGQQAEPARDFLIGFLNAAEVLAEAVLVELLVRLDVPQAATVGLISSARMMRA